ncbi:MAG: hypothetical protein JXM74_07060, partial [Fusobacteriaceae bacterium]|nr:hypothetical protein [Fusobacteriaceae bacterium]
NTKFAYWHQFEQIRMSPGCFEEVLDKCKEFVDIDLLHLPEVYYIRPDYYPDDAFEIHDKKSDLFLGYFAYERVGTYMHMCWYQEENVALDQNTIKVLRDLSKNLLKIEQGK